MKFNHYKYNISLRITLGVTTPVFVYNYISLKYTALYPMELCMFTQPHSKALYSLLTILGKPQPQLWLHQKGMS